MNLWAELGNEQSPLESAGRAQKQKSSHGRRLREQVVLSSLRNWLLHDYVASYCRSLAATRIYKRCYWIDALGANTPANKDTPIEAPMIVPVALHSIIMEAGSSRRKEGRTPQDGNAGKHPAVSLPKEGGSVRASWLEIAPTLLNFIDQSPAIFLLNPFGHTLFTYDDLAPLYLRMAPTELCLLISHRQLETRVIPLLRASAGVAPTSAYDSPPAEANRGEKNIRGTPPTPRQEASPPALPLTALLRSDRWKALVSKGEEIEQIIDGIIDLFIASMQRHFLSVQRIELPVQVRPMVVETAPYTLIFATRRQDSLASMNDAVCLYRRRLYEQSSRGFLIEDWFVTQQQERLAVQAQQLYARTLQLGRNQRVWRWPDLRQQLMLTSFGQFTLYEYDEVIRKLLRGGEVRCEWRQRFALAGNAVGSVRTEDRIPGNDDVLVWL